MWLPLTSRTRLTRGQPKIVGEEARYPGARGVHQAAGAHDALAPAAGGPQRRMPEAVRALGLDAAGRLRISAPRSAASMAFSTTRRASSTQQSAYENAVRELRLERSAGRIVAEVDLARSRQLLAAAQMVVEEQAEADHPGRAQLGAVRQDEAQRPDDVRRRAQQHLALDQRLAHQAELVVLEIAQTAVDQLAAGRGGVAGEVILLAQQDGQPATRRRRARCPCR